ncbi:MAG: diadenylate cyclase CdaA [Dehalococcoidia bacterium]|nr:diadenylate cyclase CdaA [Dehalococcoidia bacterium]
MEELLDSIGENLGRLDARSVIDILLIAAFIFWVLLLLRGTTAMAVLRGSAIVLIGAFVIGRALDLRVLNFLLRNSLVGLAIAVPIVFQPELRRALERLGRAGRRAWIGRPSYEAVIDALTQAAGNLAERRHGALLVLERETGLQDYIDTGVRVDAAPSAELLEGIFYPNSPLHDGAVILRENRVIAAACTLPLAEDARHGQMGTRHRAALGITERTDAISVVVSEETGQICLASDGRMLHRLDEGRLRASLISILGLTPKNR